MNPTLQAIKALFRKVQTDRGLLSVKITNAQTTADNADKKAVEAKTAATNAQATADNAQTIANNADAAAVNILNATVIGMGATVSEPVVLVHGKLYIIIPSANADGTSKAATLTVNGTRFPIYEGIACGIHDLPDSNNTVSGYDAFRAKTPILVMYNATLGGFYCFNRSGVVTFHDITNGTINKGAPDRIVGRKSTTDYYFYPWRIASSTAGSSKLFDITVDDSGTITAVEV